MSGHQHATLEDTVYFWFAANDTSGSGGDGATPLFDVREAGAAASAIPLLSGTPALLTHVNFPAGCYEVAVAATAGNGFAADDTFAVFCTLAVDSQNPSGFVGSCKLGPIPANTTQISGDSGAADNLEAMYDATGYTDGTAPASRSQVDAIGAGSGGSVNIAATSDNVITDTINDSEAAVDKGTSPETVGIPVTSHAYVAGLEVTIAGTANYNGSFLIDSVSANEVVIVATFAAETFSSSDTINATIKTIGITGNQTANTFANTATQDGVSHTFTDTGNVIDVAYRFSVGGGRTASAVRALANVDGNNDEILIKAYDFVGTAWDTVGTIDGSGGTVFVDVESALLLRHTGTSGADLGVTFIRLDTDSTTPSDLAVDLLLVSAVNTGQANAYELGQIWINTNASNEGTEDFVDGRATRPVSTIAAAKSLSTSVNIGDFHIINGSSFTLAESTANESYFGDNWTLALGGQAMAGAHFEGCIVSGTQTGTGVNVTGGSVGTVTLADDFHLVRDGLTGTITLAAGNSVLYECHSIGSSAPILDFGAAIGSTTIHCHAYSGSLEIHNFGDSGTDILNLTGEGKLTINSNSSGGTINLEGDWEIVNNAAAGAMTINLNSALFDYQDGAIWINTNASNTSTIPGFDGTVERPVSTIAAAKALSTSLGITDFHVINGSSITLAATSDNESYFGDNWTLALGGQQTAGAHFQGADVSGIQTGSGMGLDGGELVTCTLADDAHMDEVGLSGTITLPAGSVEFFNCHHDGASLPILDFGDAVGSTTVHMHSYHGGIEVQNMGDSGTDIVHLDGMGRLDINANCTGGTINVRGTWDINDSSGGAVTLVQDDVAAGVIAIEVDTGEIGTGGAGLDDLGGMSTGMKAEVNAEVVDVLKTDTVTLPGQVAPPLAPTFEEMISWLYKTLRNRKDQTATLWQLYADDESTVDAKATVSSDGTTAVKQEIVTGP